MTSDSYMYTLTSMDSTESRGDNVGLDLHVTQVFKTARAGTPRAMRDFGFDNRHRGSPSCLRDDHT